LYGLLGVSPDAPPDEIRRAYYRAARQLHPDVNPQADAAAAMRRLNDAWAVLGDPVARRRYDARLSPPAPLRPARPPEEPEPPEAGSPHPPRFVRPSALIITVLLVIFVVTAYAGHGSKTATTTPTPTATSAPAAPATTAIPSTGASNLLGECLQSEPGYDAVVPCGQPNLGEVVMLASASTQCPPDTRAYQLIGRPQWVCLRPSTSG
jgi:curved DNA-binding protein CbpA